MPHMSVKMLYLYEYLETFIAFMNINNYDFLSKKGVCSAVVWTMEIQHKLISDLRGPSTLKNLEYRKIEKWSYFQFFGPNGLPNLKFKYFFYIFLS